VTVEAGGGKVVRSEPKGRVLGPALTTGGIRRDEASDDGPPPAPRPNLVS
jgi:hypothetical protein